MGGSAVIAVAVTPSMLFGADSAPMPEGSSSGSGSRSVGGARAAVSAVSNVVGGNPVIDFNSLLGITDGKPPDSPRPLPIIHYRCLDTHLNSHLIMHMRHIYCNSLHLMLTHTLCFFYFRFRVDDEGG